MARVHFFFWSIGLACLYCPASLAAKASPQPDSAFASTQPDIEVAPLVPSKAPEEISLPNTEPQKPTSTASTTPKKPVYMAETIRMQRAWIYSALMPGVGQVYNGHYWKAPAMYAIFGALGWGAVYNHQIYRRLDQNSKQRRLDVEFFRRNRDLCVIFMGLLYIANVFDAYAGASLKTFNLSDDISVEVQPGVMPAPQDSATVGLNLTFKF